MATTQRIKKFSLPHAKLLLFNLHGKSVPVSEQRLVDNQFLAAHLPGIPFTEYERALILPTLRMAFKQ